MPDVAQTASTGEIKAKLEPRYAGNRHLQIVKYSNVPIPFMNKAVAGSTCSKKGTSTVEPNMAKRCCKLSGIVGKSGSRSSTSMIFLCSIRVTPPQNTN